MRTCALAAMLLAAGAVVADEPDTPDVPAIPCAPTPASAPASQPAEPAVPPQLLARIDELIAQLGDESFDKREAAEAKLKTIGEPARAALEAAARSKDAEIAERAGRALDALDRRAAQQDEQGVGPGAGQIQVFGGQAGVVSVRVIANDQMKLTVRQDAEGLHVEHVTTDADGKQTTDKADAKDMDDLKKKAPKLHAVVLQHFGAGGAIQVQVQIAPGPEAPPAPGPEAPAAPEAARLAAALAKIGVQGRPLDAATCGKLKIAAGILVDGLAGGQGAAAGLGVRRGDVITAVNGRPLAKAADVVAAAKGPLRSLTVYRAGRQLELTPPPQLPTQPGEVRPSVPPLP